jgi:hypothetical protein
VHHPDPPPTATQYALFVCFLVIGPAFGVLGGWMSRDRGRGVVLGALLASCAAWGGWLTSCVVAVVLFPHYPADPTPGEPLALVFTAPGLVAGAVALRIIRSRGVAPPRASVVDGRRAIGIATLALATGASLVWLHDWATTWPARRALPDGAVVIEEELLIDEFIGDYEYRLDARMSEEEFETWMRDLAMEPCPTSDSPTRWCRPGANPDAQVDSWGAFGRYENGIAHFGSWSS